MRNVVQHGLRYVVPSMHIVGNKSFFTGPFYYQITDNTLFGLSMQLFMYFRWQRNISAYNCSMYILPARPIRGAEFWSVTNEADRTLGCCWLTWALMWRSGFRAWPKIAMMSKCCEWISCTEPCFDSVLYYLPAYSCFLSCNSFWIVSPFGAEISETTSKLQTRWEWCA